MPLTILEKVDPAVASEALAGAMLSLTGKTAPRDSVAGLVRAVLSEARVELNIPEHADSFESNVRLRQFLSEEVERRLFAGVDRRQIRRNLGQHGRLPFAGYKMEISDAFRGQFTKENPNAVLQAIERYAEVEHLFPDATQEETNYSLVLTYVASRRGAVQYPAIVIGSRFNDTLAINAIYRIIPKRVMLGDSPLQTFKAFVRKYDTPFNLGGTRSTSGIVENVALKAGIDPAENLQFILESGRKPIITAGVIYNSTAERVLVKLAYAVDQTAYMDDVSRFG